MGRPSLIHKIIRHDDTPVLDDDGLPTGETTRTPVTTADAIIADVRAGLPYSAAAKRAGIDRATMTLWRQRGEDARARRDAHDAGTDPTGPCPSCGAVDPDPCLTKTGRPAKNRHTDRPPTAEDPDEGAYLAFLAGLEKAEGDAIARNLAMIQRAAPSSWQAAAWWLERRYPAEFGRTRLEVTGADGGPVQTETTVTVADLEAKVSAILGERD